MKRHCGKNIIVTLYNREVHEDNKKCKDNTSKQEGNCEETNGIDENNYNQ
jgi:hypothetical protein